VIEHRSVFAVTASANGKICFALVPSPYGCIAIDEGIVTATVNKSDVTVGAAPFPYTAPGSVNISGVASAWQPATGVSHHYGLLPYSEALRNAGEIISSSAQYGLQQAKFRVLSTQAKVSYIGNDFNNEGVACTGRLAFDLDANLPSVAVAGLTDDQYFCKYGAPLPQILPDSFSAISVLPGSRVFPITQTVHMINAPQSFNYQPMKDAWVPFLGSAHGDYTIGTSGGRDVVFGGMMASTTAGPVTTNTPVDGILGVGHAPITFFAATGLALVADNPLSILIEARCCIEYTLAYTSPSARFASLPPPERPLAIQAAHNFGRLIPSSVPSTPMQEEHGFLHRFWDWYWPLEKKSIGFGLGLGAQLASRFTGLSIGGSTGTGAINYGGRGGRLAINN